jgi:hypothetical protein
VKIHAGLVWLVLPPRLADELAADPRVSPLVALRLDEGTLAVREASYRKLREALVKRGVIVEEVSG